MKNFLSILIFSAIILFSGVNANAENMQQPDAQIKQNFEQRLQLTKRQKEKARIIHQEGLEQMKPVIMRIELLRTDLETLKKSNLNEKIKEQQIARKQEEIKSYERRANEIRRRNSKEFESILTKKQKLELEKMKAEGRARFSKQHPPRPPFGSMPSRGFWEPHRLFPPLPPLDFMK